MVIEPFTLDGRSVRSSEIRSAIAAGDLDDAASLLGRPVTLTGALKWDRDRGRRLDFDLPIALPPDADYPGRIDGTTVTLRVEAGQAYVLGRGPGARRVTVELSVPAATMVPAPRARGSRSEP
jgi:hypothetical protein